MPLDDDHHQDFSSSSQKTIQKVQTIETVAVTLIKGRQEGVYPKKVWDEEKKKSNIGKKEGEIRAHIQRDYVRQHENRRGGDEMKKKWRRKELSGESLIRSLRISSPFLLV